MEKMTGKRMVNRKCVFCGNPHSITVKMDEFVKWTEGELIQKAMPNLTATEREQLISGICPKCQKEIFGE